MEAFGQSPLSTAKQKPALQICQQHSQIRKAESLCQGPSELAEVFLVSWNPLACVFAGLLRRYGWWKAFSRSRFSILRNMANLAIGHLPVILAPPTFLSCYGLLRPLVSVLDSLLRPCGWLEVFQSDLFVNVKEEDNLRVWTTQSEDIQ